jgi:hypothetical protein
MESIMNKIIVALLLASTSAAALADGYVKPHVRKDGTFVNGHYRTAPDASRYNNHSTQGNVNPYTGQKGYADPYASPLLAPATTYQRQQQRDAQRYKVK